MSPDSLKWFLNASCSRLLCAALSDGPELLALTVYRKGAEAIRQRLEEDARTIATQQRQLAELKALAPRFREQATDTPQPPQQLSLIAAEDMPIYRTTGQRSPSPRR